MSLDKIHSQFTSIMDCLNKYCEKGSAMIFVCASYVLDYLTKIVYGKITCGNDYKDFIINWLSRIRPEYSSFQYNNGNKDLPVQMYHVLRCGIVHSFSLIPDNRAQRSGGRDRSIVLCHKKESVEKKLPHLSNYSTKEIENATIFVAEDFLNDIRKLIDLVFDEAKTNSDLRDNILKWTSSFPLITGGF